MAYVTALRAIQEQVPGLASARIEVREENEPVIVAPPDHLFQPYASVFIPMIEPDKRIPLRSADGVPHPRPPKPGA